MFYQIALAGVQRDVIFVMSAVAEIENEEEEEEKCSTFRARPKYSI
jgi:hypothetical protein